MQIENIPENAKIKINKNSITVLNENGKTAGVVTSAQNFLSLQANKQINYAHTLRALGIWGHKKQIIKYTYICDGKILQFRNINSYGYLTDDEKAAEDLFYNSLTAAGVVVKPISICI